MSRISRIWLETFDKQHRQPTALGKQIFPLLLIVVMMSACTGLAGEPEVVRTVPPPTSVPKTPEPAYPQSMPDIEKGAQIFASRCVDCHGKTGDGTGKLVLEGSIPQPPDMTDIGVTSLQTPMDWYNTITNGRIENLMPPWRNALTPQERWDVAFYTYTLAYDDDMLTWGKQIWEDKCADCDSMHELTNLESAVNISDAAFGNQIDRNDFNSNLTVDEMRAAVAFARSQSVENPSSIGLISEPLPVSEDPNTIIGNLTGVVKQGTPGGVVPADTVVQLQYGNDQDGFEFAQTTINEDNTFIFEDIPLTSAYNYSVGAVYRDRLFSNSILAGHGEDTDYNQTLTIYDLTDDPFVISISRIDMFVDPISVPDVGQGLRVTQIIRYNNSSDRMYTTGRAIGDGREAVTLVQVPVGALITSGEANGRYIIAENIEGMLDSIIDTNPILPGDRHEIVLEYFVPYEDGAIIDQPFVNAIDGEVSITTSNNLEVVSDTFTLQEEGATEENLKVYAGNLTVRSNPSLKFEVTGNPFIATTQNETVISTDALFPILLVGVVIIVILIVGLIIFSTRGNNSRQKVDMLIKQIAELDSMHDNGQINHDVYQRQRQELKQQLTELMQSNSTTQDD